MSFDGLCSDFFGQQRLCCFLSHHINEIWAKSLLSIVKSVAMYEAQFTQKSLLNQEDFC